MPNDYRDCPTVTLIARWEALRDKLKSLPQEDRDVSDLDALWEMRREIDRRRDVPKPKVDVNFANDYLTD